MTIDTPSLRRIILPIRLGIDPMEGLLVADFKGDPEFQGIEPQVFDDPINGKGMRVLRYRKDGKVDVYWQPGVRVDKSTFTVGSGICDFAETTIEPAYFKITSHGMDLNIAFTDAQGRKVELRVQEDAPGKKGFPLLAPVGADVEKPPRLMLVFMPGIDLVRSTGSLVEGRIGDRILSPASLPILLDWHRVLFIRYVAKPVIGTLNPPMNKPLIFEMSIPGSIEIDGMVIVADEKGRVTRISAGLNPRHVELNFSPAFPNLPEIQDRGSAAGRWTIHIAGVNITGGSYSTSRKGDRVAVELDVTEHWKPSGLPLAMELFTRIVPMFRTWPATYRWRGVVELGAEPVMSGVWERKGAK
jgi:hypothetical protein